MTSPAASRIFISYRREDSGGHVLALIPALRHHFGADRIFLDIDNIPPGLDFVKYIQDELDSCSVLLAVIGKEWLTLQHPRLKIRRLDDPNDFLRLEVATALRSERIRVIPVLLERTVMPAAEDLPSDLAELPRRQAFELSDRRWEADVQSLIKAIHAAAAPVAPTEVAPVIGELEERQRRRNREIAAHLQAAMDAFDRQDYEGVLWACDKALLLDPTHLEALRLLGQARKAIDDQRIASSLDEAERLLGKGEIAGVSELIDQALAIDASSDRAERLREELLRLRRHQDRERERARMARAALDRARSSLDEGDLESAVRQADDALGFDPNSAEAGQVKAAAMAAITERRQKREQKRRAEQAVDGARRRFAAGDHEEALRLLREFAPPHDLVAEAISDLQKQADALAERRRDVDRRLAAATEAAAGGRYMDAIALLEEIGRLEPGRADVAALLDDVIRKNAAAGEAAQARARADAKLTEASARFADRQYSEAMRLVLSAEEDDPTHPAIPGRRREVEQAVADETREGQRRETIRRALFAANTGLDAGDLDAALEQADAVLRLEPAHPEARRIREAAEAAAAERRRREQHDAAARQVVARARQVFDAGEHRAAVHLLERFTPAHDLVTEALDQLREELHAIEARRREEQEQAARQREEAEKAAAARKRADALAAALSSAHAHFIRGDFDAAIREADAALGVEPHSIDADTLRTAAIDARAERQRRAEAARLREEADRRAAAEAARAAAEAARQAEAQRLAEARAREREDAERTARELAAAVEQIERHLASGERVAAEQLLAAPPAANATSPVLDELRHRARTLRDEERRRQRRERMDRVLATIRAVTVGPLVDAVKRAGKARQSWHREGGGRPSVRPAWATAMAAVGIATAAAVWTGWNPLRPDPPTVEQPQSEPPAPVAQPVPQPSAGPKNVAPPEAPSNPDPVSPEVAAGLERLQQLKGEASRFLRAGQRAAALDAAARGLQIEPADAELQSVLDRLLADARAEVQQSRAAATRAGAADAGVGAPSAGTFKEGQTLEGAARRSAEAGRRETATRGFWTASERYALAERQATSEALARQKQLEDERARAKQLEDDRARQKQIDDELARQKQLEAERARAKAAEEPRPPVRPQETDAQRERRAAEDAERLRKGEETRVRDVIRRYEEGYDALDAARVRAVFPSVSANLEQAFRTYRSYDVDIRISGVAVSTDLNSALAYAEVVHEFQAPGTNRQRRPLRQVFVLDKRATGWVISRIDEWR